MTKIINQEVDVNAFYFTGKEMRSFPRQMQYDNKAVTFADGLRLSIQHGSELTYLYDMNDTEGSTYRLRQDDGRWMLVGVI